MDSIHAAEVCLLHRGVALDLVGRAFGEDTALVQHADAPGQLEERVALDRDVDARGQDSGPVAEKRAEAEPAAA